jgi:hypothetical protein
MAGDMVSALKDSNMAAKLLESIGFDCWNGGRLSRLDTAERNVILHSLV